MPKFQKPENYPTDAGSPEPAGQTAPLPPNSVLIGNGKIEVTPAAPVSDAQASAAAENAQLNLQEPKPSEPLKIIEIERVEEWHVTVLANSPVDWRAFCEEQGVTALFIELNTGGIQLMSAIQDKETFDEFMAALAKDSAFTVVRVKHEVQALKPGEKPLYYEAHAKFDRGYRPDLRGASRDLFRLSPARWYVTRRQAPIVNGHGEIFVPFTMTDVQEGLKLIAAPFTTERDLVEIECEWCLEDSNPGLDGGWL